MLTQIIDTSASQQQFFSQTRTSIAASLGPAERKTLSLQVLTGTEPVTHLAQDYHVSRKFLYQQAVKARHALDRTFSPSPEDKDVIFDLPITKDWIRQFVLSQVLIGHSSFRAVMEILDTVLDYQDISIGTIHNIVSNAIGKAKFINQTEPLSAISIGAHDEIYQAGKPVLVGMVLESTYCYLLAAAEHCEQTTWGVHLLDLAEQGLRPDYTIADGGRALRAGQAAALGDNVPCNGDVFHAERDIGKLAFFFENRAAGGSTARQKLERKMERAKNKAKGRAFSKKLDQVRQAGEQAIEGAKNIRTLADWMQNDSLSLAGPELESRQELYDFVGEQLRTIKALCPDRIEPVLRMLENNRDNLLAFAGILDERVGDIAARFDIPLFLVHAVCELQGLDKNLASYWQRRAQLQKKLIGQFDDVEVAVCEVLAETPRARSMVENLNSRLRNYFFLRRHIGNDYLDLLRFFINHRTFMRSERAERVGKSPAELLTGKQHPHWLELLGFERFSRN